MTICKSCKNNHASWGILGQQRTLCRGCAEGKIGYVSAPMMPRCLDPECSKIASFAPSDQKPLYCKSHIPEDMVCANVVSKRCEHPGCDTIASYGFPNGSKVRCVSHALDGMTDIINKRCEHTGCDTRPNYGFPGEKAVRCASHALDGMIDVNSKRCEHPGCYTIASYGFPNGSKVRCASHALDGMTDIINKRCKHPGCITHPSYGFPGEKAVWCASHALDGMINVVIKRCEHPGCDTTASYGFPDGSKVRCVSHALTCMICLGGTLCPGYGGVPCPVKTFIDSSHPLCASCDPDPNRKKKQKTTENKCFGILDKELSITDHQYPVDFTMCGDVDRSRAYIDAVIITSDIFVCIEIDEYAHEHYDKICEEARMHDVTLGILQSVPNVKVFWIRANPHPNDDDKKSPATILKVRMKETIEIAKDVLANPRSGIKYIGY